MLHIKDPFTPSVSDDAARWLPKQFYCFGDVQLHLAEVSASMLGVTVPLSIHGFDLGAILQSHRRRITVARCKQALSTLLDVSWDVTTNSWKYKF